MRPSTAKAYESHTRQYEKICKEYALNVDQPLSEKQQCFVWTMYAQTHKMTSLPSFIAAINSFYLDKEWPELIRNRKFKQTMKSLQNLFARTSNRKPKKSISLQALTKMFCPFKQASSFRDCRDYCASVFAFFGLLRRSEYVDGALLFDQVKKVREGIELKIVRSKTSRAPQIVAIYKRSDDLCPVKAYDRYVQRRGQGNQSEPFFTEEHNRPKPMNGSAFIRRLKKRFTSATGRSSRSISGHSFRRGGATAMAKAGISNEMIQHQGRWKSERMPLIYTDIQNDRSMRMAPSKQLQQATTGAKGRRIR